MAKNSRWCNKGLDSPLCPWYNTCTASGIGDGLSVHEFVLAFRRFTTRRGMPHQVLSDNARTFKAASKLTEVYWSFHPPASPWFGGFAERLVKSIKMPLNEVLGQALLSAQEIYTILTEIEPVVNTIPLTHEGDGSDKPSIT